MVFIFIQLLKTDLKSTKEKLRIKTLLHLKLDCFTANVSITYKSFPSSRLIGNRLTHETSTHTKSSTSSSRSTTEFALNNDNYLISLYKTCCLYALGGDNFPAWRPRLMLYGHFASNRPTRATFPSGLPTINGFSIETNVPHFFTVLLASFSNALIAFGSMILPCRREAGALVRLLLNTRSWA